MHAVVQRQQIPQSYCSPSHLLYHCLLGIAVRCLTLLCLVANAGRTRPGHVCRTRRQEHLHRAAHAQHWSSDRERPSPAGWYRSFSLDSPRHEGNTNVLVVSSCAPSSTGSREPRANRESWLPFEPACVSARTPHVLQIRLEFFFVPGRKRSKCGNQCVHHTTAFNVWRRV